MISIEFALAIHAEQLLTHGGAEGIRDRGALESALARPFSTFGGDELIPDPIEKAAALLESVAINHPFVDGNKRTAFVLALFLLRKYGIRLAVSPEERYQLVIAVASGELRFDGIVEWLRHHTVSL